MKGPAILLEYLGCRSSMRRAYCAGKAYIHSMSSGSSSSFFLRFPHRWLELLWIVVLGWLSLSALFPFFRPTWLILPLILGLVIWKRAYHVLPTLVLFGIWHWLPPFIADHQFSSMWAFFLPLMISLPLLLLIPKRYSDWSWMKRGEWDSVSVLFIVLLALLYSFSVILWAASTNNLGSGLGLVRDLENIPKVFLLLIGVPVFSFMVAVVEEVMFRGLLQQFLQQYFSDYVYSGILFMAFVFSVFHYANGVPSGTIGFILTFVFGFGLGYLRSRTGSIYACFLAHFFADLIIGITFTVLAR